MSKSSVKPASLDDVEINEMGWILNDFLVNNGAKFDGRVFNNMKKHLVEQVNYYLKEKGYLEK